MSDQLMHRDFYATALEAEERRHALIRQRIRGIRASYRHMPVKEIAFRVGVSAEYVERALAPAAAV